MFFEAALGVTGLLSAIVLNVPLLIPLFAVETLGGGSFLGVVVAKKWNRRCEITGLSNDALAVQYNETTLGRASEAPALSQAEVLLRPAVSQETAKEELLRVTQK